MNVHFYVDNLPWNDIIHVTDFNHEKLQLTKSLEYPDPVFGILQGYSSGIRQSCLLKQPSHNFCTLK